MYYISSLFEKIKPLTKKKDFKIISLLILVFIISRVVYYLIGIRFDDSALYNNWQYIDPPLLKDNLFQSLFYLHSQPPFFNFLLGIAIKILPNNPSFILNILFMVFGIVISISLYKIFKYFKLSTKLSFLFTVLFMISPSVILYENLLFYTYLVVMLLSLQTLLLFKFLNTSKTLYGFLFFLVLAIMGMTRTSYHILWFILLLGVLIAFKKNLWKKVIISASFPLLILTLLYIKNLVVFQNFTTSSWLGMNITRITTQLLPDDKMDELVEDEELSPVVKLESFSALDEYEDLYEKREDYQGIPVLRQETKSDGSTNFNNINFIEISRIYQEDAFTVIRLYPKQYLLGIVYAYGIYFHPVYDHKPLTRNLEEVKFLTNLTDFVSGRKLSSIIFSDSQLFTSYTSRIQGVGLFIIVIYVFTIGYFFMKTFVEVVKKKIRMETVVIFFILSNIFYTTLVSTLFEIGENNRFRFEMEPQFYILFVLLLVKIITKVKASSLSK